MKIQLALASAAALALAACGNNDTADDTVAEATPSDTALPTDTATPDASSPQGFVDTMAASDMYEIEAGRLAQDMGKSQAVKDFGAMMVKDHTTSSDKLKAAVGEAGNGLAVTPAMTPVQQGLLDQLRGAGENFDAMYAQQQVDAHETALATLQAQAQSGTVEQLRTFAADTAKVVQGHLDHARSLGSDAGGAQ
jgi:putative membrane protein